MKKSEDVQLPLFSNAEFSSSIPSRATSKQENDFIVIIRNEIQNFVKNGGDYSKPIVLNIDLKKIASERGLSRWEPLQRSFKKTIDTIKQYPLNQTIQYLDEDDNLRERTYWMLSYIDENPKQGIIEKPGGYLQKMLQAKRLENTPFRQLAMRVIAVAPEYRDAVVDATAEYQSFAEAQKLALEIEKNRKSEPVTIENNAFLKELSEKGLIPKAFEKQKKE